MGLEALVAMLTTAFWSVVAAHAPACDTPVYRYAMYRWMPLPYQAYYLHRGQPPKADQELHRLLAEEGPGGSVANVFVTPIDLDRKDALDVLPEPVKSLCKAPAGKSPPKYVLTAPWGAELLAGDLDSAAARGLIDSPLRSEIGRLFDEGHGIVLLIVNGKDSGENTRVEAAARAVMAKAASGTLLEEPPPDAGSNPPRQPGDAGAEDMPASQPPNLRIGLVKLQRVNAAERWLLKMLMAMAPDLEKSANEPMLYAIYGRGRVMPPGIGKEVTAESLAELLRFLGDRCSCTIKDQNPGLDLLMRWNWEATAEKFAAEERAGMQPALYAEVAADPTGSTPSAATASGHGAAPAKNALPAKTASTKLRPAGTLAESGKPGAASATGPSAAGPQPSGSVAGLSPVATSSADPAGESAAEEREAGESSDSFAARQRLQLGLGLIAAGALVVAAGFVLLRRLNHG